MQRLMCPDGKHVLDKLTKKEDPTDKERHGEMMEVSTLVNTRTAPRLKEKSINFKQTILTHSSLSSMMIMKKRRKKKK
jgi:hypothetical protein